MAAAATHDELCRRVGRDVAAYLDGELEAPAAALFDQHLRECRACAAAVSAERRLLRLLDNTFGEAGASRPGLPRDFARVVTARARVDMRGVRGGAERTRALLWCATLSVLSFALLGATMFESLLAPPAAVLRAVAGVLGLLWRVLRDAGEGAGVILRALGGLFVAQPLPYKFLQWGLFACAVLLLCRLIGRYHRAPEH